MTGVRLNCEKKIEHDNFKIKIGTTNKLEPKVVYVEGRTFLSPLEEYDDYSTDMNHIKQNLKTAISKYLHGCPIFDGKFILDFQVAASGIKPGKRSFLSFQIILKQKENMIPSLLEVKRQSEKTILDIINAVQDDILKTGYTVSKTKR